MSASEYADSEWQLLLSRHRTASNKAVGERLGVSAEVVRRQRAKRGFPKVCETNRTGISRTDMRRLLAKLATIGVSDSKIARDLGVTRQAVQFARRALGVETVRRPFVDWSSVDDLHDTTAVDIARRFSVTRSSVYQARGRHPQTKRRTK